MDSGSGSVLGALRGNGKECAWALLVFYSSMGACFVLSLSLSLCN